MSDLKVPHVQRVKKPDGRIHLYFRKGRYREGPLLAADGTPELLAEVNAIIAKLDVAQTRQEPREGTVSAMLLRYAGDDEKRRPCAEFLSLAASTQVEYLRMATEMRLDLDGVRLDEVTPAWLGDLMGAWRERGYKAANDRRQVLKNALEPAIADDRFKIDPFGKVRKLERPHDGAEAHEAWEDGEVAAAIDLAMARKTPGLARAIALARWGGFRRGTICVIPLNARVTGYDDDGAAHDRLYWLTAKRRVLCDKAEDARLTALIAGTPNQALTISYNADGGIWKPRQLAQAVERLVAALVKVKKCRPGLTLHGLRHARGVELALAGASDAEIMAQLEHATDRAAKIYRRQADRRKMADAGQKKVDNVISIRAARAAERQEKVAK